MLNPVDMGKKKMISKEDFMKMLREHALYEINCCQNPNRRVSDRDFKRSVKKVYKGIFGETLSEEQWNEITWI